LNQKNVESRSHSGLNSISFKIAFIQGFSVFCIFLSASFTITLFSSTSGIISATVDNQASSTCLSRIFSFTQSSQFNSFFFNSFQISIANFQATAAQQIHQNQYSQSGLCGLITAIQSGISQS
jgi:hypothetical protein